MRLALLVLLPVFFACTGPGKDDLDAIVETGAPDADADGSPDDEDCDDDDATVYPGAVDAWYDGIDANCDGADDYDQDGDGIDGSTAGADCDDVNPAVYPGADEVCNGLDDDCDGVADDDALDLRPVYADLDGDGYGGGDAIGEACEAVEGTALDAGDCDDNDPTRSPGEPELCDGVDNDCSGAVDDDPIDGETWYPDLDADGFGDTAGGARACEQPPGYIADATDCDDADPLTFPDATEICDLGDNDCDGAVDDGATDERTYYGDADGDGYGEPSVTATACGAPAGFAELDTDCDDSDPALSPGATELCNGYDDDCDGEIDSDSPDAVAYYPDVDADGYGDPDAAVGGCSPVPGYLLDGTDCDDSDGAVSPAGVESCDGADNDCDTAVDESDAVDAGTWYLDGDGDGYGDAGISAAACDLPSGYAASATDCDDGSADANPGRRETCDGADNNCDGTVDEATATDASTWYADADSDGYGDATVEEEACAAPAGFLADNDDCDDTDATVNPGAAEDPDLVDDDCDDVVDEDFVSFGDIVVNEVARQTYTGGSGSSTNANAQWFELANTSAFDIDIAGWSFEEQDGDTFRVAPGSALIVPAGGYAVLCYDDTWFADPAVCDYTWGDSALGAGYYDTTLYFDRDEDLIALYLIGTLMDEVLWELGADASGDSWPRTARYSMELDPSLLDPTRNDLAGSWCLASASAYTSEGTVGYPDYGTPGAANGACP